MRSRELLLVLIVISYLCLTPHNLFCFDHGFANEKYILRFTCQQVVNSGLDFLIYIKQKAQVHVRQTREADGDIFVNPDFHIFVEPCVIEELKDTKGVLKLNGFSKEKLQKKEMKWLIIEYTKPHDNKELKVKYQGRWNSKSTESKLDCHVMNYLTMRYQEIPGLNPRGIDADTGIYKNNILERYHSSFFYGMYNIKSDPDAKFLFRLHNNKSDEFLYMEIITRDKKENLLEREKLSKRIFSEFISGSFDISKYRKMKLPDKI